MTILILQLPFLLGSPSSNESIISVKLGLLGNSSTAT